MQCEKVVQNDRKKLAEKRLLSANVKNSPYVKNNAPQNQITTLKFTTRNFPQPYLGHLCVCGKCLDAKTPPAAEYLLTIAVWMLE